ncbi:MAG: RNA polymerase sigma factor [Pyrinomonadaceae bacterium]
MLSLTKKKSTHEKLFLDRYPELMSWAFQIAGYDRNRAEDLVHDAYIQWTLVRPDLQSIRNLDGYLYGMLRNMHCAELRRAFKAPGTSLTVVEYDSALLSLQQATDDLQIAHMQDRLRCVCDYACARKETSKAGSMLLLRFFHGYYPSEAARIAGIRRITVDSWLRFARNEAKVYLDDPAALRFMKENTKGVSGLSSAKPEWEFLEEITQRISRSCKGECISEKRLRTIYAQADAEGEALDCGALAHISSCRSCLTRAGKILDLPSKDDRYPPDFLGRDPQPGEKSQKGDRKKPGPKRFRMQIEEVVEHRPKELHLAVNGFIVGTQKIISERIEHSLKLSLLEQVGLVEVLSEQGIRLLCLYVESPPEGAIEQSACVNLSDERTLNVTLSFQEQWPRLELAYSDPHFAEVASDPQSAELLKSPHAHGESSLPNSEVSQVFQLSSFLRLAQQDRVFWVRPALVTVLIGALVVAALLLINRSPASIATPDLLSRAQFAERAMVAGKTEVVHRNIGFEQRKSGKSFRRQRIEFWQNGNGNTARRLYGEDGSLVAGAWQNSSGSSQNVFYSHGSKLKVSPPSESTNDSVLKDHLWLLDPSATSFSALVHGLDSAPVEKRENRYIVRYRRSLAQSPQTTQGKIQLADLSEALLVLDATSLHALSQTFVFDQDGERIEVSFNELSIERLTESHVSQKLFQPDPELLIPVEQPLAESHSTIASRKIVPTPMFRPPSAAELGAVEVNILYLLDQINANSGEQIEVRRLPGRELVVEAIVDTDKRKQEILQALASVASDPLVRTDVVTLEEAVKRETSAKRAPETVETVVILSDRIPVYDEVRRYLEREMKTKGYSSDVDAEIRRLSSRVIDQSRKGLLHAFALKHLVERFSDADLKLLNTESRQKWHEMIRSHARAFRESSAELRGYLGLIFPHPEAGPASESADLPNDASLIEAVKSLVSFASATDDAISRAFSLSPDMQPVVNTPKGAIFWRTLSRSESLAAALEQIP